MRRIVILSAALFAATPAAANQAVGHTYLTNRDVFQSASPERVTFDREYDRRGVKEDRKICDLSATGIYVQSVDEQGLRDYFLPKQGATSLIAGELYCRANQINSGGVSGSLGNSIGVSTGIDLFANYFNVFTANVDESADFVNLQFQSTLSFKPKQKIGGIALQWQQSFFDKYFFKASAPIIHISNNLNMEEVVTNAGATTAVSGTSPVGVPAGAVGNMTAAFKQTGMRYGKIECAQEKWGVADLELIFGRDWITDATAQMNMYLGLVVPTGNRPKAEYLWEAVVGNNHHWGAFFGSSSRYIWREGDNYEISAYCDTDARYLFENTQTRMIDLQGRPWSRYIYLVPVTSTGLTINPAVSLFDQGLEFGVNVLTQAVRVAPHGSFTINSALNFRRDCGFEAEGGVNFYARQVEHVKLANPFVNDNHYGIPAAGTDLDSVNTAMNNTVSFATINNGQAQQAEGDVNYAGQPVTVALTEKDLDLGSAATPAVLESTFYGAIGKNWNDCKYPYFAGLGGSYTYIADNASIRRFAIWGKAGITF